MDTVAAMLDRQEAARADRSTEVQSTLDRARTLFAGLSKGLEAEISRLEARELTEEDDPNVKKLTDTVRTAQKVLATVLDAEVKLMRTTGIAAGGCAIDLEDARAEVARRLARLAA